MKPRDNPFAAHCIDNIPYHYVDTDQSSVLIKCQQLRFRAAIIGSHGSGKTTLLHDLGEQLAQHGHRVKKLFINTSHSRYSLLPFNVLLTVDSQEILLFDGADLLPRPYWWVFRLLSRRCKGLIVTSHQRALLPALIYTKTDTDLLAQVLKQLNVESDDALLHDSQQLFVKHQGNIRDVLRDLYLVYADK